MIPRVAGRGESFKGAGAYYLHDKQADTAERVAFTHTENLPTNDPEMALRMMAYTAMHHNDIKAAYGTRRGQKPAGPVYTYSLSWHADDPAPSQEHMIEAALETLKALGFESHEVLMIGHDDTQHPHIHVIVNRINPKTGKAHDPYRDFDTLSAWAGKYQKRHGQTHCPQRDLNNERRRRGEFVKYRDGDRAAVHRWRKMRGEQARYVRRATAANLSASHRGQRQALYDHKERRIAAIREDMRAQNRPKWAALFKRQREEWKALNDAQRTAYSRLRYFFKQRDHQPGAGGGRDGMPAIAAEAMRAVFGRDNPHGVLSRKHRAERAELARDTRQHSRAAMRHINKGYRRELGALKAQQHEETCALAERQSRESQDRAQAIKEGRDVREFRRETGPAMRDEFERRAWEKIRDAKQRREEERKRGRDRDGGRGRDR